MNHRSEDMFADSGSLQAGSVQMGNLQLFTTGSLKFAIFAEDIATIAEWRSPTPLPHAPHAVLGVVSIQGRMLTVLDPEVLLGRSENGNGPGSFLVALRGDEQLALAVNQKADVSLTAEKINPQSETTDRAVLGIITHQEEMFSVLDVKQLFALALRGRERRLRRF